MPAMSSRNRYIDDVANRIKYADPQDPWATVTDTPWGDIQAWKASTLATGSMGGFDEYMRQFQEQFEQVRADAAKLAGEHLSRARELDARARFLNDQATKLIDFAGKLAVYHEHLKKRDEEQTKFAEPVAEPARDDDKDPHGSDESPLRAMTRSRHSADEHPSPTGDLHVIEAKQEPELTDDQGSLPEELLREAPPETGSYPTLEEPPEPQVPQPGSVSLNKEED